MIETRIYLLIQTAQIYEVSVPNSLQVRVGYE